MSDFSKIYTPKQLEIYKRTLSDDWFMLINHGAKRSGKTQLNNDLFLQELIRVRKQADIEKVEKPMYILSGVTITTIYQNILNELINKYSLNIKLDKYGNFTLFGVYVVQVGHGTIAGLGKIRGMTAYGAYINEASLANPEVFDEIKSRCSGFGARVIADTNPDNPEHWLKKDYIDNKDSQIITYKFTLYDNSFLNERYIENIVNTTPTGVFTDRNIYGNWVSGDGVIYKDFNVKVHYIYDLSKFKFVKYIVGVDWGYSHYGTIVVIGITEKGEYVLIEEYAEQFQEIDYWVQIALDIKDRFGNIPFYCDSARPEHVKRFAREGIKAINADKLVVAGIELVSMLYKQKKLFIYKPAVKRFSEEIFSYKWGQHGEVVKEDDDVQDAIRYAIYSHDNELKKLRTMNKRLLGL